MYMVTIGVLDTTLRHLSTTKGAFEVSIYIEKIAALI